MKDKKMFYYINKNNNNGTPIKSIKPISKLTQKLLGLKNIPLNKLQVHWSEAKPLEKDKI